MIWALALQSMPVPKNQTVVLLLVKNDLHEEIHDKVVEYGIFTLSKPFPNLLCFMRSVG